MTGTGTGTEAISITLPNGTGMSMEVSLGCNSAGVTIVDGYSVPIVSFNDVQISGSSGNCRNPSIGGRFGADFRVNPGRDFVAN